jgi:hypothetical protein
LGGFGQGGNAQLFLQNADTSAVLLQGSGALIRPDVELHQLTVSFFTQRVKLQPATSVAEGGFILTMGTVVAYQLFQSTNQFTAQLFGLLQLPFVEGEAIAQGKAAEKVIAVEINGRF